MSIRKLVHAHQLSVFFKRLMEVSTVPLVVDGKDGKLKHKNMSEMDDSNIEVPDPATMHHW